MTLSPEPPAALAQDENRLPFDPASLPTIESIGAESNIRAFLEAGVPGDLARAALRRAWSLDPAIRDFVGLSENSWDFNAPGTMAGFGPIDGEEVGRLLTRLLGEPDTIAAAVHPPVISPLAEDSQSQQANPIRSSNRGNQHRIDGARYQLSQLWMRSTSPAVQHATTKLASPRGSMSAECRSAIPRRSHGGALPNTGNRGRKRTTGSFSPRE